MIDPISIGLGILGIAGALGGASAYFKSNRSKAIIELQEKEIEALNSSNNRLEKENAQCRAMNEAKDNQIATLEGLAKQTPEIVKLVSTGTKQHKEVMSKLSEISSKLGRRKK